MAGARDRAARVTLPDGTRAAVAGAALLAERARRAQRVQGAQMGRHGTEGTENTEDTSGHRGHREHAGCRGYIWRRVHKKGTQGTEGA